MSTAGLSILSKGYVQTIGDFGLTFSLVRKRTVSLPGGFSVNWAGVYNGITMHHFEGVPTTLTRFNTWELRAICCSQPIYISRTWAYQAYGAAPTTLEIYEFGRNEDQRVGTAGLQVFDAQGLKTFDSDWKPMKILTQVFFDDNFSDSTGWQFMAPPGTKVAIALSGGVSYDANIYKTGSGPNLVYASSAKTTAISAVNNVATLGQISLTDTYYAVGALPSSSQYATSWSRNSRFKRGALVVDVTGL